MSHEKDMWHTASSGYAGVTDRGARDCGFVTDVTDRAMWSCDRRFHRQGIAAL